jgi:hypothetical protein
MLAGNAVFYIFVNPTMAHAMSFGLIALLMLLWWRQWELKTTYVNLVLTGLLLGLLISIRTQNILFGLLPAALLIREIFRTTWYRAILSGAILAAATIAAFIPQLLHSMAYVPVKSALNLLPGGILVVGDYPIILSSPFFLDVLFSCRHGAFHWTPVLFLATIGLIAALRKNAWTWVFLAAIVANVYLIGGLTVTNFGEGSASFHTNDWNNHWGGAPSFGMRYLTECTPFFAVGMAYLLNSLAPVLRSIWAALVLFLLTTWNGLLILSYGLGTLSRAYCVSYMDMLTGVMNSIEKIFSAVSRVFQ